jgi:hypothetical protein
MFAQRVAEPVASDSEIVRMPRRRLPGFVIPGDSLLGLLHWVEVVRPESSRVEYEPLSEAAGLADHVWPISEWLTLPAVHLNSVCILRS